MELKIKCEKCRAINRYEMAELRQAEQRSRTVEIHTRCQQCAARLAVKLYLELVPAEKSTQFSDAPLMEDY